MAPYQKQIKDIYISFSEAQFVIDDYNIPSYLYECIGPMRVLFMQKSAPKKYNKVSTQKLLLCSHDGALLK